MMSAVAAPRCAPLAHGREIPAFAGMGGYLMSAVAAPRCAPLAHGREIPAFAGMGGYLNFYFGGEAVSRPTKKLTPIPAKAGISQLQREQRDFAPKARAA